MESAVKKTLKSLCCSNGWSYGVFWRFDQRNSMLLTLEDAYYEEQMRIVMDNMLQQVQLLGEGIIGQAAFTGKHRWMFSDTHSGEWNLGSAESEDIFQDDSEIQNQFSSGIKTIAVISVGPRGVVQFGSTQKILERVDFLDQTKRLFQEIENVDGLIIAENAPSSLNSDIDDSSGLFASIISAGSSNYGNLNPVPGDGCKELMGHSCSLTNFTQSSPFTLAMHHGRMPSLSTNTSHIKNQLQPAGAEAQGILSSKPNFQLQQVFSESTTFVDNLAAEAPCNSTWSREGSTLTSFEQRLPSEMGVQSSPYVFPAKPNTHVSCNDTVQSFQDSTFTSLFNTGGLLDMKKNIEYSSGKLMDNQNPATLFHATECELLECSTSLQTFQEDFKPAELTAAALSKSYPLDDVSQWFAPSPEHRINGLSTTLNDDLSQEIGVTSVPSRLDGGGVFIDIPVEHPASSLRSSTTNIFNSDGKAKTLNVPGAENDMFDCLELDFGCRQVGESWEDILMPVVSGGHPTLSTGISECMSELDAGSMAAPRKGLFSELGIEQLLGDIVGNSHSVGNSSFEDQLSTSKRRRTGSYLMNSSQVKLANLSCLSGTMNSMLPVCNLVKANNLGSQQEVGPKSQVGLWIDDSYSINAGSAVIAQPKRPEEPAKATKKRARPGESTRPRPKDRQQIQDRIQDLRKIIPNGSKCSIDSLLDRTIKHMIFLQSVTKYADKLRQAEEPKLIGQDNGVVLKDNSSSGGGGGGGATWAYEVGGQTLVCPIIVEDLSPPGQMLIEMLCEDRGLFLEIAHIIQGFGLNILKGVMEIRENKLWARFIVEANRQMTRIDIFWSLVQFLQQSATSGIDSTSQPTNVVDGGIPQFNNYQQPPVAQPISLAETLR